MKNNEITVYKNIVVPSIKDYAELGNQPTILELLDKLLDKLQKVELNVKITGRYVAVIVEEEISKAIKFLGWELRYRKGYFMLFDGLYWRHLKRGHINLFLAQAIRKVIGELAYPSYPDLLAAQLRSTTKAFEQITDLGNKPIYMKRTGQSKQWKGKHFAVVSKQHGTWKTDPCIFCGAKHSHGVGDGHRIAHCKGDKNEIKISVDGIELCAADGYFLEHYKS